VERIFFLGAFDASNTVVQACRLTVEANPPHTSNPVSVDLQIGQYAEVRLDPKTLDWSDIIVGQAPVSDEASPEDARNLVKYVRVRATNHFMPWNTGLNVP
jgi:hypothetical protein